MRSKVNGTSLWLSLLRPQLGAALGHGAAGEEAGGGSCDLGGLKAGCPHSLVSVIKKTKMIFKEPVSVSFIPVRFMTAIKSQPH